MGHSSAVKHNKGKGKGHKQYSKNEQKGNETPDPVPEKKQGKTVSISNNNTASLSSTSEIRQGRAPENHVAVKQGINTSTLGCVHEMQQKNTPGASRDIKGKTVVSSTDDQNDKWEHYTEAQLERLLCYKLGMVYSEAFDKIKLERYSSQAAQISAFMGGQVCRPMDILNSIVSTSIDLMKKEGKDSVCANQDKEVVFTDMYELLMRSVESLISMMLKIRPDWKRSDALHHVLRNEPSLNVSQGSWKMSDNPPLLKNLSPLQQKTASFVPKEYFKSPLMKNAFGDSHDHVDSTSRIMKGLSLDAAIHETMTNPEVANLVNLVKKAKEHEHWARETITKAEKCYNRALSELNNVRENRFELEKQKDEEKESKKPCMRKLYAITNELLKATFELDHVNESVPNLEAENAAIEMLSALDFSETLQQIVKRDHKMQKKLTDSQKVIAQLKNKVKEEKQKKKRLEKELRSTVDACQDVEMKLRQQSEEKQAAYYLVTQEKRLKELEEASLKKQRSLLLEKLKGDHQRLADKRHQLEQELFHLDMQSRLLAPPGATDQSTDFLKQ